MHRIKDFWNLPNYFFTKHVSLASQLFAEEKLGKTQFAQVIRAINTIGKNVLAEFQI
jgi:hypothetical protein